MFSFQEAPKLMQAKILLYIELFIPFQMIIFTPSCKNAIEMPEVNKISCCEVQLIELRHFLGII